MGNSWNMLNHECSWMWNHTKITGAAMPAKCFLAACRGFAGAPACLDQHGCSRSRIKVLLWEDNACKKPKKYPCTVSNYHQTCPVSSSSIFPLDRNPRTPTVQPLIPQSFWQRSSLASWSSTFKVQIPAKNRLVPKELIPSNLGKSDYSSPSRNMSGFNYIYKLLGVR